MIFIAKYDYFKKAATVKQYNVDDDFLEFLHLLKNNGQRINFLDEITDDLVNSFTNEKAGAGWQHDNGIQFGMSKSKEGAIHHLIQSADEGGDFDEEDMGILKKAFSGESGKEKSPMTDQDKNKLRSHAGIEMNTAPTLGGIRK